MWLENLHDHHQGHAHPANRHHRRVAPHHRRSGNQGRTLPGPWPEPGSHRVRRPLETHHRQRTPPARHGPESHHPNNSRRTRPTRHQLPHPPDAVPRAAQTHPGAPTRRLHNNHSAPARPAQQTESPRIHRRPPDQLPRHRPASHRHRPRPRSPHRHHHQRPHHQRERTHPTLRTADDHRTTPRRHHQSVPRRRPDRRRQPQRRPRHHPRRPRPGPHRSPRQTPPRLRHQHPRHPATPIPGHPRHHHHHQRHHHHPTRTPRLLTRPPTSRPPHQHHRPLVGKPNTPLRIRLTPLRQPTARKSALTAAPRRGRGRRAADVASRRAELSAIRTWAADHGITVAPKGCISP